MHRSTPRRIALRRTAEAGFTLIEIMVVVFILGLLAAMVTISATGSSEKGRVAKAKADMSSFAQALEMYQLDCAHYPSSLEDLLRGSEDCWDGPYIKGREIASDPWNNPYVYEVTDGGKSFRLCSQGGKKGEICFE